LGLSKVDSKSLNEEEISKEKSLITEKEEEEEAISIRKSCKKGQHQRRSTERFGFVALMNAGGPNRFPLNKNFRSLLAS